MDLQNDIGAEHLSISSNSEDMANAIAREKQIKSGSRQKKVDLIEKQNPDWRDLYDDIV